MAMAAAQALLSPCTYNGITFTSTSHEKHNLRSDFLGARNGCRISVSRRPDSWQSSSSSSFTVRMAISREKKEATVEKAKAQLDGAYLVAAIDYGGLSVKQMEQLRKSLPDTTTLIVAKNKLIGKAIEGTEWEALEPILKGMNAWLFVHSDEIQGTIKPYRTIQKEYKLETDFTGAVFEGKFYGPKDFKELESMPTRSDLFSKLLGSIQSPASNLVGTLQGPARELIMTLNAHIANLEAKEGGSPQ